MWCATPFNYNVALFWTHALDTQQLLRNAFGSSLVRRLGASGISRSGLALGER